MCGHLFPMAHRQKTGRMPHWMKVSPEGRKRTAWRQAQQSFLLPFVRLKFPTRQPTDRMMTVIIHRLICGRLTKPVNPPIIDSGDGATDENGTESPKEAQDGTIGGEDAPE